MIATTVVALFAPKKSTMVRVGSNARIARTVGAPIVKGRRPLKIGMIDVYGAPQ